VLRLVFLCFLYSPPGRRFETCLGSSVGPPAPTNETTNGLIRQYLPKRQSMAHLTQHEGNRIAAKLNRRPRKRLGYRTPEECYAR